MCAETKRIEKIDKIWFCHVTRVIFDSHAVLPWRLQEQINQKSLKRRDKT